MVREPTDSKPESGQVPPPISNSISYHQIFSLVIREISSIGNTSRANIDPVQKIAEDCRFLPEMRQQLANSLAENLAPHLRFPLQLGELLDHRDITISEIIVRCCRACGLSRSEVDPE